MPQSSQTPSRRDDLLLMLLRGGAATNSIATHVVDTFAAEVRAAFRPDVLREAIEAARGEYLHDQTGTPEDEAYNQAVSDVVAAIGALLEGGAR